MKVILVPLWKHALFLIENEYYILVLTANLPTCLCLSNAYYLPCLTIGGFE